MPPEWVDSGGTGPEGSAKGTATEREVVDTSVTVRTGRDVSLSLSVVRSRPLVVFLLRTERKGEVGRNTRRVWTV